MIRYRSIHQVWLTIREAVGRDRSCSGRDARAEAIIHDQLRPRAPVAERHTNRVSADSRHGRRSAQASNTCHPIDVDQAGELLGNEQKSPCRVKLDLGPDWDAEHSMTEWRLESGGARRDCRHGNRSRRHTMRWR